MKRVAGRTKQKITISQHDRSRDGFVAVGRPDTAPPSSVAEAVSGLAWPAFQIRVSSKGSVGPALFPDGVFRYR